MATIYYSPVPSGGAIFIGYGGTFIAVSLPPSLQGLPNGILSWLQANFMNFRSSSCVGTVVADNVITQLCLSPLPYSFVSLHPPFTLRHFAKYVPSSPPYTCEKLSRVFQKNWTCLSVSSNPTWYFVCLWSRENIQFFLLTNSHSQALASSLIF